MSEDIASLAIRIDSTETDKANRSLKELEQQGSKTEKAALGLSSAFKSLGIAIGAASFGNFVRSGINALDTLNDLSLKTGIAANKLAGMQLAAKQSGTSIDTFAHSLNLLSVNMANNSQAFAKLGISAKDPLDAFYQLVGVMEAINDPQTRAAVGAQALGRGWQELAPLLANGVNGLKDAVIEGERLSGVTVQATKDADAFNDQVEEMTTWLSSLSISLAGPVIAGFNQLSSHIREATKDGLTFINVMRGIGDFISGTATLSGYAKQLKDTNDLIDDQEKKVNAIKNASSITGKIYEIAGVDIKKEKQSLDNLYRTQEELYLKIKKTTETKEESAISKPDTAAIKEFIGVKDAQTKAVEHHAGAIRASAPIIREAQRTELDNLAEQHAKLTLSERDYYAQSESVKKLSFAQREYALAQFDIIKGLEREKEVNAQKQSEMDSLIDKYNQLTLSARDYFKTQLESQGIKGDSQQTLLTQFDKNTGVEAQKKALEQSRAAFDNLVSSADSANEHMQGLAATTTSVFDSSIGGANQLIGAFDSMIGSIKASDKALKDLNKTKSILDNFKPQNKDDTLKLAELRKQNEKDYQDLQAQTVSNYLDGTRQMAGAAASMFQENEAAQIASQSIALVTLGIQAVQAIVSQGQGDPYTAFARIAAMAAIVGALVSSVGGSSVGSSSIPQAPPNSADTGTVLGDKTAQSESVNNVTDLLKSIHADEYIELRGINKGVAQLAGGILGAVTKTFQTGAITGTEAPHLGQSKYKLVSGGLATREVSLADLLSGDANIGGQMYTTEQLQKGSKKKPKFSFEDYFTEMDDGVTSALKGMFEGIGKTMSEVSGQLGKDIGKDLSSQLNEAILPALKIDILGLSGEDAVKKVNAVISTAMDTVATQVFGDIIGQYQQLGEGMLETAIRIVSEVAVVRDALNQSGLKMSKNAIELSDSLVQASGGLEEFQKQFESFYDAFFTESEKQARLQERLTQTLKEAYVILPPTREMYRKMTESLNLNNSLDRERYSLMLQLAGAADQYYSAIEDGANNTKDLSEQYARQEIEIMKLTGDTIGALTKERKLELKAMDESLRVIQSLIYIVQDLSSELEKSYNNAAGMLTATFTTFFELAKSLVKYRDSLKTGPLSTGSPESKYFDSRKAFDAIQATIAAGPGKTDASELKYRNALGSLESSSQALLENSRQYNASGKGYTKDFGDVMKALTSGANKSLDIASNAEKQLNALNDMVSGIADLQLSIVGLDGSIKQVSSAIWETSKTTNKTLAQNEENLSGNITGSGKNINDSLGSSGVKGALTGNTGSVGSAVKAVRDSITGTGTNGVTGALNSVSSAIGKLNSTKGITGAVESVKSAVSGLTKAMIEMVDSQKERDRITKEAAAATSKSWDEYLKEQARLTAAGKEAERIAANKGQYGKIESRINVGEMTKLFTEAGMSADLAQGSANWAKGLIGSFDTADSMKTLVDMAYLVEDFRKFLISPSGGYNGHDGSWFAAEFQKLRDREQSHANGLNYVPYDGYTAKLHQGEKIQTRFNANADEAETRKVFNEILMELKAANKQRGAVAVEMLRKYDKIVALTEAQTRAIKRANA